MASITHKLQHFGSLRRDGQVFDEGVVFLMYHKVGRPPLSAVLPALYVHPRQLAGQLDELAAAGLKNLAFDEAFSVGDAGGRGFCLTFDDGFANVFDNALPLLRARDLTAIQFVVAGLIGRDDAWDRASGEPPQLLMDDGQIREWLAQGQEIGSHTLTHPWLSRISAAQAQSEIRDSKRRLEDRFGVPIRFFCYPFGDTDAKLRDMVEEAGYEGACTTRHGAVTAASTRFELPRVLALNARRDPKAILCRLRRITYLVTRRIAARGRT